MRSLPSSFLPPLPLFLLLSQGDFYSLGDVVSSPLFTLPLFPLGICHSEHMCFSAWNVASAQQSGSRTDTGRHVPKLYCK